MDKLLEIERSIIKKYRNNIWKKFIRAVVDYKLIEPNDNIAVCISGGKDSMLLAKCMQELKKHGKFDFGLKFIVMDPGYAKPNRELIESNLKLLNIDAEIFETNIFNAVTEITDSPCYLCARMRRGYLYKKAQSLGCNKIALGHHFDDVIETVLLSMFYGAEFKTMMPKLHSTNHKGMELIRPLYYVKEADIKHWQTYNGLKFLQCACKFTEGLATGKISGKRTEIKNLISSLREINENVDINIFRSLCSVNLSTILGYKKDNKTISFLDYYDKISD